MESLPLGYPIRLSRDQRICATPPGLSQLITAFFASQLLGIHHKPIFAWPYYLFCFTYIISNNCLSSSRYLVNAFLLISFLCFRHEFVSAQLITSFKVLLKQSKQCKLFRFSFLHYVCQCSLQTFSIPQNRSSWRYGDSNPRPTACKAAALANWAISPGYI